MQSKNRFFNDCGKPKFTISKLKNFIHSEKTINKLRHIKRLFSVLKGQNAFANNIKVLRRTVFAIQIQG